MTIRHPGPQELAPGLCPGGVVVHVYEVPSERLLCHSFVKYTEDVERAAQVAGEVARTVISPLATGMCLVAWDGDTGHRFTRQDWQTFG